ncbi:MAG: NADH-quinone oxidoreductase subunit M, partial [Bacteroidota bacterium]|nr:NADH-quinone oxidoreductase subunit M [Bacteroidota bacterium]
MQGGLIQMFSHGINVIGLFLVCQIFFERRGTHNIQSLGGYIHQAPLLAVLFMVILLGSIALPLTNGFIGEFMLLAGIYRYNPWMAAIGGLTIIFGAVYMLRAYQRTMLGNPVEDGGAAFPALLWNEKIVLLVIAFLVLAIGIFPGPILAMTEPSVQV